VKMANIVRHPEVPNEEDEVKTVGALKHRYGDRHLAIGRSKNRKNGSKTMVGPGRTWPPSTDG
jgi:hypothetical protein